MTTGEAFNKLKAIMEDTHNLRAAAAVLQWDMEVCMPPKGAEARGRHLATLSACAHERFTDAAVGKLIDQLHGQADALTEDERALFNEIAYQYERATCIPEAFVRRHAKAQSAAYHAWLEARKQSDFSLFKPHLECMVNLAREKADYWGYEASPYDALLEEYERGMTVAQLRVIFDSLATRQRTLIARIMNAPNQPDLSWLEQPWNKDQQLQFTEHVLRDIGYDFAAGRQDQAAHPFTTSFSIQDVRVTTRVDERMFFSALYSSIHEGGHALYEQGYSQTDEGTLLADAPSLGMHESQSRLWENLIGRSLPFWRHYLPVARGLFPGQLDTVTPEQVYAATNRVTPSLIRVESDECTYNLHIILRFELETALIEGTLDVADVPAAWNEKMATLLDIEVPDDAHGCLQDIHWSHGAFGYFPTYALGNLYAAQLFDAMTAAIPDMQEHVACGTFDTVRGWLRDNIHCVGRRKTAPDIITDVTGAAPQPDAYLNYLETKYTSLYGLS